MSKKTDSYICQTCGVEHDSIPKALRCFESHEAKPEHVLEESVTLEAPAPGWAAPAAPELLGRGRSARARARVNV